MAVFPESKGNDPEDVATALDVGRAQFARGDLVDALKWLRKAVDAAFEAGLDGRGVELSKSAVELSPGPRKPTLAVGSVPPPVPPRSRASTAAPPVPPPRPQTPSQTASVPPRGHVPMPPGQSPPAPASAPLVPAPPRLPTVAAPESAASPARRTSAAGTRRNTRGPKPESLRPPAHAAPTSAAPTPTATPTPTAAPASRTAAAVQTPPRKAQTSAMRANTLEVELEESTDAGAPMPVPAAAAAPVPTMSLPASFVQRPPDNASDPDSTQVFKPSAAMLRTQIHQSLRVGVSRGAAGVVVRVLDGPVRTGELEAMLVSVLPNGALAELFNVK